MVVFMLTDHNIRGLSMIGEHDRRYYFQALYNNNPLYLGLAA